MDRLNITKDVLDKLGFSDYWDEHGTWGGRTLIFNNGSKFRIIEQEQIDDENEGRCLDIKYIPHHYYFIGWFAIPKTHAPKYDLFFLHEMQYCVENEYPDCLDEFVNLCVKAGMKDYLK